MESGWAAWIAGREGRVALALAVFAGFRVAVYSLAFPFFTNVDESRHLDVVLKYARGYLPRPGPDFYEPDTARWVGRLGSPEYQRDPENPLRPEVPPPVWAAPPGAEETRVLNMERYLEGRHSLEADQSPLYYGAAGLWLVAGRGLGLEDGRLLYWVRGLGAFSAFALVLAAAWVLRSLAPDSGFVRLGVPALLAAFPLDSVYYLTGDALSPLLGGLAFLLVARLVVQREAETRAYVAAGLALAAAFLCKYPNAALFAGALVCTVGALSGVRGEPGALRRWAVLWAVALLPPLLWLGRNWLVGGDLTGTAVKIEGLDWGRKPAAAWPAHPLLTPSGLWIFVRDLVPSFWRGELVWERFELRFVAVDSFYRITTLVFLALAAFGLARGPRSADARAVEGAALASLLTAAGVLGFLSLIFLFHETSSPSIDYPFFVQGRLVSGVLAPFALLYVRGIEEGARLAFPARQGRLAWAALGLVIAVALLSELVLTLPVFGSAYNGFHLP
jgi:hypothetical protein